MSRVKKLRAPGAGRKPRPRVHVGDNSEAALKRFLVASAAHNARVAKEGAKARGHRLSWAAAIESAVNGVNSAWRKCPTCGVLHSPGGERCCILCKARFIGAAEGAEAITATAVEALIHPRKRDRATPWTGEFEVVNSRRPKA